MKTRELKESFFEESAHIFKILSSPIRLKLLNYISYCPRTVDDCAQKFGQSMQNISLHLQALAKIEMLEVQKLKNYRIYSLSEKRVLEIFASELIAGPRTILPQELTWNSGVERLANAVKAKKASLIDLREPQESAFIPVAGALDFDPESSSLKTFLKTLPPNQEAVFFCRGNWCEKMATTVAQASKFASNVKGAGLSALELQELDLLLKSQGELP